MKQIHKIGLGGGCHWCTEGIFQSLIGVEKVEQGWINSNDEYSEFSEAITVEFDSKVISLKDIIEIHLHTHASESNHSFRNKYRSAVYYLNEEQQKDAQRIINYLQSEFEKKIITKVLPLNSFKLNDQEHLNYLYTRENNGFCTTYIHPKLRLILDKFANKVDKEKIKKLNIV